MVSQSDAFANQFLQIWSFVTNKNVLSLNYFFTRNSFLSTSATLCNTLIIYVCNKSIILLPHGFALESWHLYCAKLIIIYRRFPKNSAEINQFRSCLVEKLGKNVPTRCYCRIFRDLSLIQSVRFMAMLFVICLLVTFWISFYRDQQERLVAE